MTDLFGRPASSAVLSDCGVYRYELRRVWEPDRPLLAWVMLNPSTATATEDDPTIRRCIGFAKAWSYGGIVVVNLFGLRATDSAFLKAHPDPVGPDNDEHIRSAVEECGAVVCAWGSHSMVSGRAADVLTALTASGVAPLCLGRTTTGRPRHPLYVRAATRPVPYRLPAEGMAAC